VTENTEPERQEHEHETDDIVELLVERAKPGTENPGSVISHAEDGRVVIFDKAVELSYKLQQGQLIRARISKVFDKYYVAAPLAIVSPNTQSKLTFGEVVEEILGLSEAEKAYLVGGLGLPLNVERFNDALRRLLGVSRR